ncbi:hypothetical protein K474DRAFT_1694834 [Panus rudis PR-1116 ss-1]|nr:hypothetical protein K474DRAFT_1694834 [Panus rudis PR-1116 ss-1]
MAEGGNDPQAASFPSPEADLSGPPATDYNAYIIGTLSRMTRSHGTLDQTVLQRCLALSSSYLLTDTTMNPSGGLVSWNDGFNRLVDVMSALHARGELQLETINEASKACSECWGVAGGWRELEEAKDCRTVHGTDSVTSSSFSLSSSQHGTDAVNTDSSVGSSQSDQANFSTPLGSPQSTVPHAPLVESPTSEQPPPLPDKDAESNTAPSPSASNTPQQDYNTLTPLRAHYLKKELVQLQFHREFNALMNAPGTNISTFSYLGPPFTPPPKDGPRLDLPFLRYIFRQFVLTFPFLAAAPKDFFPEKLQPFLASFLARDFSAASVLDDNPENSEEAQRLRLLAKLERNFTMLLTSGTKLVEKEDVVRLTQSDLNRLETLARRRAARERRGKDLFEVNIVGVKTIVEKGRVRSRAHEAFIIRTRRSNAEDIFVSRRYGDFRTLANELRKAHPSEVIPPPPAKDKSFVDVPASSPLPTVSEFPSTSSSPQYASAPYQVRQSRSRTSPMPGGMYRTERTGSTSSFESSQSPVSVHSPISPTSSTYSSYNGGNGNGNSRALRLAREKNRLTLRSYLHTLLSSPVFAASPVLKSFLLSNPIKLTPEEQEDARRREEADLVREDGRKRFAQEIRDRVDGLRGAVRSVKGELLGKDGLTHIFATIKTTEDVRQLPENYQAVIEWARISLASTVFQHFVAADNASESFASMKRIHGLMPYFMLKAALKISNPMAMIRGVLDLFLAQPFGGRSLLQRMFTGSLMEEVKALEEDIEAVKAKVDDPVLCEKVRLFVNAPREIQAIYKADAAAEKSNVLTVVLRSGDQPSLSRAQLQRVMRAHYAHREYVRYTETLDDSDDDEGPQNEDAWLYEDLTILAKLYSRLKDREQLIALIFEGSTAELLKDIITIFYAPLAQVYRAASIADSLGDLQNFINDLIRTVEQTEEIGQEDPAKTVQTFIDLIQRHEQAFYSFVHKVHSKGEGLFDSLMRWIELFLTLMRDGLGEPISLEFLLPHPGREREEILKEVDEVARYHYKLKLAYEAKVRRRFGRTQGQSDADAEDQAAAALVNDVVSDLSFGDLVKGDADDLAAEATDDEDDDESSDDDDDDDSSEDSSSEESDTGSSESSSTEGPGPSRSRGHTPMERSHTIGHSPLTPTRSARDLPVSPMQRAAQSLDYGSSPSRPPVQTPPLRPSRSMSIPASPKDLPPVPSSSKPLPPSPFSRQDPGEETSNKKRKKADGPKPPELEHIPKLLPLFVEMMRPLLRPRK